VQISEKRLSLAILLLVLIVQAVALAPELVTAAYRNNDSVSHFALINGMAQAVGRGESPLDFWSAETSLGLPMARWYQPLGHLMVIGVYFAAGKLIPLVTVFLWAKYLSMLLLPVSFYLCALWLDVSPLEAAATALLAPLIGGPGPGQLGMELRSWLGFGAYPQAVGGNLLLLSIGLSYRAIRRGRGLVLAGAMVGLTLLAHLIYGWMGALVACLIALLPDEMPRLVRLRRLVIMGASAAVLAAFLIMGIVQDGYLINRSRLEPADKYDSYGAQKVLTWLFTGQIMDHDRVPVMSLLALAGIVMVVMRWRKHRKLPFGEVLLLAGAGFFLLVLFGRPTWGALVLLIGATRDLHLHRVIGAVQIFLVFFAGVSLAALWRETARRWHFAGSAALTLVLLFPMIQERATFIDTHTGQGRVTYEAVQREGSTLDQAIAIANQRGGRTFAGLSDSWGAHMTLGRTPVYAFLINRLVPTLAVPYNFSALPSDLVPKFDQLHPLQYRIFNVRTMIAPKVVLPDFLSTIGDVGNYRVIAAPGEGYFGMIDVVAAATADRDNFYDLSEPWLRSQWAAADRYIWLDFNGDAPKNLPRVTAGYFPDLVAPSGSPGAMSNERQTGQTYDADLTANRNAYLIFRMTYHPAWKITVDGKRVKTAMVTPGFVAAPVTAGSHHVRANYEPGSTRNWIAIAGFGIVAGLLLAGRGRW
jgi:hypothetical protein